MTTTQTRAGRRIPLLIKLNKFTYDRTNMTYVLKRELDDTLSYLFQAESSHYMACKN